MRKSICWAWTGAVFRPTGARLAFVASGSDQRRTDARLLDELQAAALSGTEDAETPFFSPDGRWLGFFGTRKLKKISVEGVAGDHLRCYLRPRRKLER